MGGSKQILHKTVIQNSPSRKEADIQSLEKAEPGTSVSLLTSQIHYSYCIYPKHKYCHAFKILWCIPSPTYWKVSYLACHLSPCATFLNLFPSLPQYSLCTLSYLLFPGFSHWAVILEEGLRILSAEPNYWTSSSGLATFAACDFVLQFSVSRDSNTYLKESCKGLVKTYCPLLNIFLCTRHYYIFNHEKSPYNKDKNIAQAWEDILGQEPKGGPLDPK